MGAGAWRPSSTEVSVVATESPGATPSEPWVLLLTTGELLETDNVLPHSLSDLQPVQSFV